jgi:hypothetical protein
MIIKETILQTLIERIKEIGYDVWSYLAPEEQAYPFLVVSPVSNLIEPYFEGDIETLNIQISVFDDDSSVATLIEIGKNIEKLLHRKRITLIQDEEESSSESSESSEDYDIRYICGYRVSERIVRTSDLVDGRAEKYFWMLVMGFEFKLQRNV